MQIAGCSEDEAFQIDEILNDVFPNFPGYEDVLKMSFQEQVALALEAVRNDANS